MSQFIRDRANIVTLADDDASGPGEWIDDFGHDLNTQRPHEALRQRGPAAAYRPLP